MKTTVLCTLTLALVAATAPRRAAAGDKERAFVAGVIGGALLHRAASSHGTSRVHTRYITSRSSCGGYGSVYSGGTRHVRRRYPARTVRVKRPSGHYETRHVKVWVPGYREKVRQPCGTWVIRNVPGHYEVRRQKVWVESAPYRHRTSRRRVVYTR